MMFGCDAGAWPPNKNTAPQIKLYAGSSSTCASFGFTGGSCNYVGGSTPNPGKRRRTIVIYNPNTNEHYVRSFQEYVLPYAGGTHQDPENAGGPPIGMTPGTCTYGDLDI
jgi:hypothetical protein